MLARLTLLTVATPLTLVTALPALLPLSVKVIVLPLTGEPLEVSVAERFAVPPYVPLAALTASEVAGTGPSLKHTVTSLSVGVTPVFVVLRNARYFRYRSPLNWLSDAPLGVKKVLIVPSGQTNVQGE